MLVDIVPIVLREVCETEQRKSNGMPLPKWSADKSDKKPKKLHELDVTALAGHLTDKARVADKYDCQSFFKVFETVYKVVPDSNDKVLVIVTQSDSTPLAQQDKICIYRTRKPSSTCMANVTKIVGTEYYLDYTSNFPGSVIAYRPTAAWETVSDLRKMRNALAHPPSTNISDSFYKEVLPSVREALEKLKDCKLISSTFEQIS